MPKQFLKAIALVTALSISSLCSAAPIIFDNWSSNDAVTGNYLLSVDHIGNEFNFTLTVDPWNAEALGLFIDLGDTDLSAIGINRASDVNITNSNPVGEVTSYAVDTSSNRCGQGCNLNGLNPLLSADGEWELVFSLGSQGFDNIQTFNFTTSDFGLDLNHFALAGIRAQQLCTDGNLLDNGDTNCDGSDKSYGSTTTVPEGSSLAFMLVTLTLLIWRYKKA